MQNSKNWINHFKNNAGVLRVNWNLAPNITEEEIGAILPSLQAWQLGETSDGENLVRASTKYASRIGDPNFVEAIKLFIKEEQKHGENLGRYLDRIDRPRIKKDWGDSLFRKVRHLNTSMESWTLTVIVAECTAQIFYQALKDATRCPLLKQICTDILIDEAPHITFQTERLAMIYDCQTKAGKSLRRYVYKVFFHATAMVVWAAHKKLFMVGGQTFKSYCKKMQYKYNKTISLITAPATISIPELYPKP